MSVILILIPLSIVFAVGFLAAFIWAVRSGQFEDTCTPSMRVLSREAASRAAVARPGTTVAGQSAPNQGAAD
jgi:cbb3-type cytochrome oxidase maturation protein